MVAGPLDRRRKRSRCLQCLRGHLKCSSVWPCANCRRRDWPCEFQTTSNSSDVIFVRFFQQTTSSRCDSSSTATSPQPMMYTLEERLLKHLFTVVIPQADFSGRISSTFDDIQILVGKSPPLLDACLALSAIWTTRLPKQPHQQVFDLELAHRHYNASIKGVKTSIEQFGRREILPMLWTALLLSLFELMVDASGDNWIRHMLYGVSKTLECCGPDNLSSTRAKRFFREARIFEISRSLIFNTPSFLALPEWRSYTKDLWRDKEGFDWHKNEQLYDILVECSDLSYRTSSLLFSPILQNGRDSQTTIQNQLLELATEGARLKIALETWDSDNLSFRHERCLIQPRIVVDCCNAQDLIGAIFHAAASIYLSGIFEYYQYVWENRGLSVPTLDLQTLRTHVSTILKLVHFALERTNLSAALFFFPLRVAGARSFSTEERRQVKRLLDKVALRFVVADAFISDLESHWFA